MENIFDQYFRENVEFQWNGEQGLGDYEFLGKGF